MLVLYELKIIPTFEEQVNKSTKGEPHGERDPVRRELWARELRDEICGRKNDGGCQGEVGKQFWRRGRVGRIRRYSYAQGIVRVSNGFSRCTAGLKNSLVHGYKRGDEE